MKVQIEMICIDWGSPMRSNKVVVTGPNNERIAELEHLCSSPRYKGLYFYCKVVPMRNARHAVPFVLETSRVPQINVCFVAANSSIPHVLCGMHFALNEMLFESDILFLRGPGVGERAVSMRCARVRNGMQPSMRLVDISHTISLMTSTYEQRPSTKRTPDAITAAPTLNMWDAELQCHIHMHKERTQTAYVAACKEETLL